MVLIKKSNRGLSHTRNVGLDYLSSSLPLGGGDIQILEHSPSKSVEYIHFLDSDDWLELDCIEICVKNALQTKAEIVWHNYLIYDDLNQKMLGLRDALFKDFLPLESNGYSPLEIFTSWSGESFSWAWCGMYLFASEMRELRFVENIESEDAPFGMMLFSLAKKVSILNQGLAIYRLRENSISQHTLNRTGFTPKWPPHMQDIVLAFDGNHQEIRLYHFDYSHCIMCIELEKFLHSFCIEDSMQKAIRRLMKPRVALAFGACTFRVDPRNCRMLCKQILHMADIPLKLKIAFYLPHFYQLLKKMKIFFSKLRISR